MNKRNLKNSQERMHPQLAVPCQPYGREIDFIAVWRAVLSGKWVILGATLLFSVISVFYALSLPNMYKSTAVLAPAQSSSFGEFPGVAGQLGGLASLAGFNAIGQGGTKAAEAIEILQSWSFIEEFIRENKIAPQVFAVTGWDAGSRELIYDSEKFDVVSKAWNLHSADGFKKQGPTSWELYKTFIGFLSVSSDKSSGFTSLTIEYYSPEIAKAWVDALIVKINTKLKAKDAIQAKANIGFLKAQIEQTSIASMQSVFYDLLEEQTKKLMLAEGAPEYVFRTVSDARASEEKSKPKRVLLCILGAIFGGTLGAGIVLVRGMLRSFSE